MTDRRTDGRTDQQMDGLTDRQIKLIKTQKIFTEKKPMFCSMLILSKYLSLQEPTQRDRKGVQGSTRGKQGLKIVKNDKND